MRWLVYKVHISLFHINLSGLSWEQTQTSYAHFCYVSLYQSILFNMWIKAYIVHQCNWCTRKKTKFRQQWVHDDQWWVQGWSGVSPLSSLTSPWRVPEHQGLVRDCTGPYGDRYVINWWSGDLSVKDWSVMISDESMMISDESRTGQGWVHDDQWWVQYWSVMSPWWSVKSPGLVLGRVHGI